MRLVIYDVIFIYCSRYGMTTAVCLKDKIDLYSYKLAYDMSFGAKSAFNAKV